MEEVSCHIMEAQVFDCGGFFLCESRKAITMTSSSTSSAHFPRISTHGVPTRCWCGEGIATFGSSTAENRKSENHLFKWIDEALLDEIRSVDAKHERVAQGLTKFEERVMEILKNEIGKVEHKMSQKLNENLRMEIARVEKEMKQKLKITTVAVVVVGAIVGIWACLTV
ncbi:hypothetical protein Bca4012_066863 [Brassica carinata]